MMYAIEFLRRLDGGAEALAQEVITLIADGLGGVIAEAEALYRAVDTVPRPDGFRVRDAAGQTVHEFHEPQHA